MDGKCPILDGKLTGRLASGWRSAMTIDLIFNVDNPSPYILRLCQDLMINVHLSVIHTRSPKRPIVNLLGDHSVQW